MASDDSGGLGRWLVVYLKGVCMGAADSVPGVSGGTIALIAGIYERLIAALTAITPRRIRRLLGGLLAGRWDAARNALTEMDGVFLVVLGIGVASAIVTVTRVLSVAIDRIPVLTFGFFFGLIAASAVALFREVSLDTRGRVAAAVSGFLLAFVVSGRAATQLGSGLAVIAGAGAIAVSAMILPGISGSLILIILGQYEYMVETLSTFVDRLFGLVTGAPVDGLVDPGTTVVTFVGGAVVGLFTVAHVVRFALEARREATMAFLVCLVLGALRAPVVKVEERLVAVGTGWSTDVLVAFGAAALVGTAMVFALDRYAGIAEPEADVADVGPGD